MELKKIKTLFVFFLIFFVLISCTSEELLIENDNPANNDSTVILADKTTEIITQWNDLWLELDRNTTGMRPNATARALAYIHLAAYETAVNDIAGYVSLENRFQQLNINNNQRANTINLSIALNKCYAEVLDHFMLNVQNNTDAEITILENSIQNSIAATIDDTVLENSIRWGNHVAQRVIDFSQTDRNAQQQIQDPQPTSYEPPKGDGFWTYSADEERALFPYWERVRTFVISSEETSSVPPPIAYSEDTNSAYYLQMKEVLNVNNEAKTTSTEQLWIAEFWSDDVEGLMMSPPGRQISIANQLIKEYDLGYEESLVILLKLGFSLNDAAVSTWADKYEYMVMRPNVYIHEFIDPDFQTNLFRLIFWPNPSFPGYPSGHSTFASAAAGVFINHFGDTANFTDKSHEGRTEFQGDSRTFSTFSEMAEENAFSRIPLGVHIRMDCTEGLRLGYEISEAVNQFNLTSNNFQ